MIGHTLRGCVDWNTHFYIVLNHFPESHPTWVCGLKLYRGATPCIPSDVTPYVGVWIETLFILTSRSRARVTPYVGVWIETPTCDCFQNHSQVTPYVGVWIETSSTMLCTQGIGCHTLRGWVDWNINGPVFGNIEDGHTLRGNIWIGALFTRRSSLWKNCKHSASYVFLSRLLILLWLEKTRTSPNAYLLSVFFCCFT